MTVIPALRGLRPKGLGKFKFNSTRIMRLHVSGKKQTEINKRHDDVFLDFWFLRDRDRRVRSSRSSDYTESSKPI